MLKSAGKLLIVLGLASLLSMGLFEAGPERRTSSFISGTGGWVASAWVDLGNQSAYLTTSPWFSLPEVEGVSFELSCSVYVDLTIRPMPINLTGRVRVLNITIYGMKVYLINKSAASSSGIVWGSLLTSALPEELKVLEKYSEAVIELGEEPSYRPSFFKFYEGKVPLKNSKEERMALFVMFSNASPGSLEPGVDFSVLMTISPELQQYARGLYIIMAGASLIVLHYLRHPEEARELSRRVRRRFPLLSGKSTTEGSSR